MRNWLTESDIKSGQVWHSCDGAGHKVTIVNCENNSVEYSWIEQGEYKKGELRTHKKTVFAFQVRYFLPDSE
jgi:hypothetical protein